MVFQHVGMAFCPENLLQSVGDLQPHNQTVHLLPQQGAPLIQLSCQQLHLQDRRRLSTPDCFCLCVNVCICACVIQCCYWSAPPPG